MKTFFALLLIGGCCSVLVGQSIHHSNIEQLQTSIEAASDKEKKLELLLQQAQLYYFQMDFDEQSATLEKALELAESLGNPSIKIKTYLKLGAERWEDPLILKQRKEITDLAFKAVYQIEDTDLLTQVMDNKAALLEKDEEKYEGYLRSLRLKENAKLSNIRIAQSFYHLGKLGSLMNKRDSSLQFLTDALSLLRQEKEDKEAYLLTGKIYREIAGHYNYLKYEKDNVQLYADSSLFVFSTIKSLPDENQTRILLAEYLTNYDHYTEALDQLNKVIANSNKYVSGETFDMMGLLSYYNKNYDESVSYYKKALDRHLSIDNGFSKAISEASIAFVYGQTKEFEKALPFINSAVAYAEENKNDELLANVYYAKAKLLHDLEQYKESIQYRKKVIALHNKSKKTSNASEQILSLATSYIGTGQLDSAKVYNDIGHDFFKQINEVGPLSLAYKNYYNLYKKSGDFEKALENLEIYLAYKDSLKRKDLQKRLNEERVNLKVVEAKESVNEAEKLKAEAEYEAALFAARSRSYFRWGILLFSFLLIGAYLFFQLRKTKNKIESQNQQLKQLNATKDKFFGIIAHDIRSPIVALDGVGEQMDYYLKNNQTDKLERLASRVDSTAKKLGGLLDNLLSWALLQQGVIPYDPKSLNVKKVGKDIFEMFQHNAETKNITLVDQINEDTFVHADESALNTILRNLVSNAIKFTPNNGTVTLSTETKDNKVFININDTGTGIAAEKIPSLFSLEKKSKKGTAGEKGTGLGLTLVKELTELNKGSITIKSVLQKGSNFKVSLPMMAQESMFK